MNVLKAIAMAFSSFSSIPMPQFAWEKNNMRYMMAAFPLIGVVIGVLVWLWCLLCTALGFNTFIQAAGYTLIPLVVSGGIHMDGFADVVDALSSHADPARKREILKDPHAGAFASIGVAAYFIAYFAFATEITPTHIVLLACIPVLSRCLSAFATLRFKTASAEGMLATEQGNANQGVVYACAGLIGLALLVLMLWQNLVAGTALWACALLSLLGIYYLSRKQFGGMNGDLAGFFLQSTELIALIVLVFVSKLIGW